MQSMYHERLEAIGQRGEACIILVRRAALPNGQDASVYSLASGERLQPGADAREFVTLDGRRSFRLREPGGRGTPG